MRSAESRAGVSASMIDGPTIPQLARSLNVPRRTLFRRLMAMHGSDRSTEGESFVPWLYRYAQGPWRVNLPRLRAGHPEIFGVPSPDVLDRRLRNAEGRQDAQEEQCRAQVRRQDAQEEQCRALTGQCRALAQRVAALEARSRGEVA